MSGQSPTAATAPFASAMTTAMTQAQTAFDEFAKMFSTMKMPAVPDAETLMAAHKRNIEALTQANRIAMEGAQAVARRHMEIVQQTIGEMSDTMRALATTQAPQDKASKQAELLRRAYERTVEHTREMAELIRTSNSEALSLLNQRVVEAMEEVKALMHKAGTSAPSA
jgi:phasin family protein